MTDLWRFRGSPYYLDQQALRLGISQVLADRARHNSEIYRLAVLMSQLSERYHRARKEDGIAVFYATERDQIRGTLEQCEMELQKLHMLAGAADAILSDAWQALGFPDPHRSFRVTSDHDPLHLRPLGNGTVGAADVDLVPTLNGSG